MNKLNFKLPVMIAALGICALAAVVLVKKSRPLPMEEDTVQTVVTVQAGTVGTGTLHGYVQAYGEVVPDPGSATGAAANLLITAPAPGVIQRVRCVEGQKVKSGDVLFEMDSSVAETAVQNAQAALEFARKNLDRQQKLLQIKAVSEKTIQEANQQLAAAQAALSKAEYERSLTTIRAAQAGTVIRVSTTQGASVNPSDVLAELWDLNRLLVIAKVPSGETASLKPGQKVILNSGATPGEEGTLTFIDDRVDPATGTVNIRIATAPASALRCGQFISARTVCTEHTGCLTVPEESVVLSPDGKTSVAVIEGDNAFIIPVTTGLKEQGRIEIAGAGIRAGMQVVTAGAYGLPDKTRIRILAR
jgi:RND family efflux transporter MFP subunit